ncbi:MAG: fibrobacter succinogenes major paralogous domain-containing protein [Bacteroidales bacterium]|nr:fibrobacter succinogenes major paralogous domain-containing protein [Bacteroidales bacterium]
MRKNLTILFLLFASKLVYSPNSTISAANLVTVTWTGPGIVDSLTPPAGITVSGLTTGSITISGIPTQQGVFTYTITTIGDDDTCEPHSITGTITVLPAGCNGNAPGWGESLGTVSRGTQEWTITGHGISQIWSDAVTATACVDRTVFNGGAFPNFNADCRSNPGFPGDLFSWCAVMRFADQLCPLPWRVPTMQDFIDLDIAMGGTGDSRTDLAFVNANYVTRWGSHLGGFSNPTGTVLSQENGIYWSTTDAASASWARPLAIGSMSGGINFFYMSGLDRGSGLTVRCVR